MKPALQRAATFRRSGPWALLGLWMLATAVAFWWFTGRNLQPFAPLSDAASATGANGVYFDSTKLTNGLDGLLTGRLGTQWPHDGVATLVHFWDPSCPCSRFNDLHVRDIVDAYGDRDVRFVVITRAGSGVSEETLDRRVEEAFGRPLPVIMQSAIAGVAGPPSSPATAVFAADGELAYFGPYSVGAACTAGSGAFVERVLDSLLRHRNPRQLNVAAFGCFCDWTPV